MDFANKLTAVVWKKSKKVKKIQKNQRNPNKPKKFQKFQKIPKNLKTIKKLMIFHETLLKIVTQSVYGLHGGNTQ